MRIGSVVSTTARLAVLTFLYLVLFGAAFAAFLPPPPPGLSLGHEPTPVGVGFPILGVLDTAVLAWIIQRSRWSGWRLALTLGAVLFGVQTFMPQVETLIFPSVARRMPEGMFEGSLAAGLMVAFTFLPVAVWTLGRWKAGATPDSEEARNLAARTWVTKLVIGAFAYVVVYFVFGYYVAWRNPAVTAYYGGTDPGSFLTQMLHVLRETPWLPLAQVVRGLLWALLALPVVRMSRAGTLETALMVGMLFGPVMTVGLLLPNPYMPYAVRMAHLAETTSSNFLFGCFLAWLFGPKRDAPSAGLRSAAA